jgi:rhomboid protease GluP
MEINLMLFWVVVLSTAVGSMRMLRFPAGKTRNVNLAICFFVLGFAGVCLAIRPNQAGFWSGLAWALLIVVPGMGQRLLSRLVRRGLYRKAETIAGFICWLRPFSGYREQPGIFRLLQIIQDGNLEQAEAILAARRLRQSEWGDVARALFLQSSRRNDELLSWLKTDIGLDRLAKRPDLIRYYLCALAECKDVGAMVAEYFRLKKFLKHPVYAAHLNMVHMLLFSYTKRLDVLEQILHEYFADTPADVQLYWRATAMPWVSEEAQEIFRKLEGSSFYSVRAGAESRLADAGGEKPVQLANEWMQLLAAEAKEVEESLRVKADRRAFAGKRKPWGSWLLVLAVVAVFIGFEFIPGGENDPDRLYRLGAMVSRPYLNGEWWRLFTSLFLHLGWLHLIFNAYALLLIGPFAERRLQTWRFLFLYFFCGMLAMWISASTSEMILLVGASGSIMGLLGASGGVMLQQFRKKKSPVAKKFFLNVLFVLVLQTTFDIFTPNVSLTAHISGFSAGFLLALLFCAGSRSTD